jgi:hypothetical protein
VVGPDGVYEMRLNLSIGMELLRWPFEASSPQAPVSVPEVSPPDPAAVAENLLRYIWAQRKTGDAFLPFIALWPHQQPQFNSGQAGGRAGYGIGYEVDSGGHQIGFGVDVSPTPDVFPATESARNVVGAGVSTDNREWQMGESANGRLVLSVKLPAADAGPEPYTLTIWADATDKALALQMAACVKRYAHP